MEAKDLMIGNCIKWKDNGSIFEVTIDLFCNKYFQNHLNKGNFEPIPLTEEVLLKCGFGWDIRFQANANEEYFFKLCECFPLEKGYNIVMKRDNFLLVSEVKYLHEFQNWFRATTRKELEISFK